MRRVRSADTKLEMLVRKLAHSLGYRYRLHVAGLPGRPDIVFPARRKVIFVHDVFGIATKIQPASGLVSQSLAKTTGCQNRSALSREMRKCLHPLNEAGWEALVLWECGLGAIASLAITIQTFLGPSGRRA